jgi:curved DNA-binding protein CbpA
MTVPLTHYQVLNVSHEASIEEIKASFRRLALEKHPDKNPGSSVEDFRTIQLAWECLRDSRQRYDEEMRREANRLKSKLDSAMTVKFSEMEEAVDDETNKIVYIYACRCGDEVEVWPDLHPKSEDAVFLAECPGCSFAYSIER